MWSVTPGIVAATNNLREADLAAWWHKFINDKNEASLDPDSNPQGSTPLQIQFQAEAESARDLFCTQAQIEIPKNQDQSVDIDRHKSFVQAAGGTHRVNPKSSQQGATPTADSKYIPKAPKEKLRKEEKDLVLLVRLRKPDPSDKRPSFTAASWQMTYEQVLH